MESQRLGFILPVLLDIKVECYSSAPAQEERNRVGCLPMTPEHTQRQKTEFSRPRKWQSLSILSVMSTLPFNFILSFHSHYYYFIFRNIFRDFFKLLWSFWQYLISCFCFYFLFNSLNLVKMLILGDNSNIWYIQDLPLLSLFLLTLAHGSLMRENLW